MFAGRIVMPKCALKSPLTTAIIIMLRNNPIADAAAMSDRAYALGVSRV